MKKIATGHEELVTGDDIADAVIAYASALARAATADTVTIPILRDDGRSDEATLLLGPASQMTLIPDDGDDAELSGSDTALEVLRKRTQRLEPPRQAAPAAFGELDATAVFPSLDDSE